MTKLGTPPVWELSQPFNDLRYTMRKHTIDLLERWGDGPDKGRRHERWPTRARLNSVRPMELNAREMRAFSYDASLGVERQYHAHDIPEGLRVEHGLWPGKTHILWAVANHVNSTSPAARLTGWVLSEHDCLVLDLGCMHSHAIQSPSAVPTIVSYRCIECLHRWTIDSSD